ncbi:hypothetical protein [Paraburkholderia adhaesiva]|uniref:hypothetical protein n=1 Tax=Paraburkholderia adhaesiva TaxID=2883244 RepID=UPI001F25732C|nr:hypothetical protein [Paraburkholderia adhaesiva]
MTHSPNSSNYKRPRATAVKRSMSDMANRVRDIELLCKSRLDSLTRTLSVEQEPYPRAHLTTLRRPIHFLAMQAISPNGHPSEHPQQGAVIEPWRFRLLRYFQAVEAISAAIEQAVNSGAFVVRDAFTGIPMQTLPPRVSEPAKAFETAVLNADAIRAQTFSEATELLFDLALLDNMPHEGVAVRLAEFDEWAAQAGIAEVGEVTRLLEGADDRMWECELALHDALERDAQNPELTKAARESAASELNRLRALAFTRGYLPDVAIGSSSTSDAPATNTDWIARARELAQEIGMEKWRAAMREITARGVAGAVATELAKIPEYHGKRGPRSADNVRSVALKGWKFSPPDEVD